MKKSILLVILTIFGFILLILSASCSKTKACETSDSFSLIVVNTSHNAFVGFNIDKPITGQSTQYSVKAGSELSLDISAGSHTLYYLKGVSSCSGNRCSVNYTGSGEKPVNQSACVEATVSF